MKYIFFSDIDGTIYDHSQKVSSQTIADISRAKKYNVEFVIATGNGYFNSIKKLADNLGVRYLILSNGAQIFDHKTQTTIYRNMIPQKVAQKILDAAISLNLQTFWWNETYKCFAKHCSPIFIDRMQKFTHETEQLVDNLIHGDISKIEFSGPSKIIDQMLHKIKVLPVNITRMHSTFVEVVNKNVSKGHAIQVFCKMFDIPFVNTASIGDSRNDLEMFNQTEYSYGMENGLPVIFEHVKFRAEHVSRNGVGKALHDFINKINLNKIK